jgi:hypothetical protein
VLAALLREAINKGKAEIAYIGDITYGRVALVE